MIIFSELCSDYEKALLQQRIGASIIGDRKIVKEKAVQHFLNDTQANEIIINAQIYDHEARLRSYEIVSEVMKDI